MGVSFNVLSYGENTFRLRYEDGTVHAEQSAVDKLPPRQGRVKRVDLMVVRTNRDGMMGMSKPCANCVRLLQWQLPKKGYTLHRVYYSTSEGTIATCSMAQLATDEAHVSRFFKSRNHSCAMCRR